MPDNTTLNREKVREIGIFSRGKSSFKILILALKYEYKEIDREQRESGYLVTFRHPNKPGFGGSDSEVIFHANRSRFAIYIPHSKKAVLL